MLQPLQHLTELLLLSLQGSGESPDSHGIQGTRCSRLPGNQGLVCSEHSSCSLCARDFTFLLARAVDQPRVGSGAMSADVSGWGCRISYSCKTLLSPGAFTRMKGEDYSLCLKAQMPKPGGLKEVSGSPYPGSETCAPPISGILSPTRVGTGHGCGNFAPVHSEERRDSQPRGGRGTEQVILLLAGLSTWSPLRQEPFSRAAIYFIHAVPLCRQSVRLTQLLLQRFTAPARHTGRDGHTASTHGHAVSCSCCSSPALKVWDQFPHCW